MKAMIKAGVFHPLSVTMVRHCYGASSCREMALFSSRCLTDMTKMTINDVHRICKASVKAPKSKLEKGFRVYANSFVFEYEGESRILVSFVVGYLEAMVLG